MIHNPSSVDDRGVAERAASPGSNEASGAVASLWRVKKARDRSSHRAAVDACALESGTIHSPAVLPISARKENGTRNLIDASCHRAWRVLAERRRNARLDEGNHDEEERRLPEVGDGRHFARSFVCRRKAFSASRRSSIVSRPLSIRCAMTG